jgi:TetR/AcrR family transcriptional repressor of nem operon
MGRPSVRPQIVQAGLRVFLRGGFGTSSVQDITEEAGVPKGSFYNHFESKEALGAEIIDLYAEGGGLRQVLADQSLAPLERLRRYYDGLAAMYRELGFTHGCLLGNFSAEISDSMPLMRDRLLALFHRWTGEIAQVIAEAQAQGQVSRTRSAEELAAFLLDAYEGAVLRMRVEKSEAPLARFQAMAFGQLLR